MTLVADEEIGVQETTAQEERPSWLPSNFEKPEDLAKSYTHAASKITEQGQELAALRSQIEEIQASQTQQQSQVYQNDLEAQITEAFESGDGRAAAAAAAFLAQQAVENALKNYQPPQSPSTDAELVADYAKRAVAAEFPDFPEYEARTIEIVNSDPYFLNALQGQRDPKVVAAAVKSAYKQAKADAVLSSQTDAASALEQLNRQVKNSAQTMSGTNSSDEAVSEWDRIREAKSGIPRFG